MKKIIFSLLLLIVLAPLVNSAECFPRYICGPWGACEEGIQSRTCIDEVCGKRDIVERDFCQKSGCKPELECSSWSQCYYTEKTDDLIKGKVSFGGYRNRVCEDKNGCVESFIQEGTCEESYNLLLSPEEECGQEILSIADPQSKRQIAKINLGSWELDKLDISFVQGKTEFCPQCYNTAKDMGEEGIDCGGPCKACKKESRILINSIIVFLWTISALFVLIFFREVYVLKGKTSH